MRGVNHSQGNGRGVRGVSHVQGDGVRGVSHVKGDDKGGGCEGRQPCSR